MQVTSRLPQMIVRCSDRVPEGKTTDPGTSFFFASSQEWNGMVVSSHSLMSRILVLRLYTGKSSADWIKSTLRKIFKLWNSFHTDLQTGSLEHTRSVVHTWKLQPLRSDVWTHRQHSKSSGREIKSRKVGAQQNKRRTKIRGGTPARVSGVRCLVGFSISNFTLDS